MKNIASTWPAGAYRQEGEEEARKAASWLTAFLDRQGDRFFLWLPVLLLAGAAANLGAPVELAPSVAALASAALALAAFLTRRWYPAFLVLAGLAAIGCGVWLAAMAAQGHAGQGFLSKRTGPVVITATVLAADRSAEGRVRALLEIEQAPDGVPEHVRLSWRADAEVEAGARISARAMLLPPPDEAIPGGYNFRRDAYFKGFGAVGYTLGAPALLPDPAPDRLSFRIERLRAWLTRRIIESMPDSSGPIAAALLTGKRSAIEEQTNEDLRVAGLGHLLSISGLHMVLVSGTVFATLRLLLVLIPGFALHFPAKRIAAVGAIVAATGFLVISGAAIATIRAYVMMVIMLVAVISDRPALSLRNLALSAIVVIALHPESVAGASFQMSFAATLSLIAAYEATGSLWSRWFSSDRSGIAARAARLAIGFLAATLFTTLVAGLATSVFGAYHFNRTTPYSLIGNMAAMPAVSAVVMPAGVLGLAMVPVGLDAYVWPVMGWGIDIVTSIAATVAGLEGADPLVASFPLATLLVIVAGGLWTCLWRGPVRLAGLAAVAAGIALAVLLPVRPAGLIDRDGYMVAIAGDGRLAILGTRKVGYVIDVWRRHLAIEADSVDFTRCRQPVCVARSPGLTIALVDTRQTRQWAHLCGSADYIVLSGWKGRTWVVPECLPKIIDRDDRARLGAIAIMRGEDGFSFQASRPDSAGRHWALGERSATSWPSGIAGRVSIAGRD